MTTPDDTIVTRILDEAATRNNEDQSAPTQELPHRRRGFREGNILWSHAPTLDEVVRDSRGAERTIRRYVGHNRGKDYKAIKWMAQQARNHKDGNEIFSFNAEEA